MAHALMIVLKVKNIDMNITINVIEIAQMEYYMIINVNVN